MSKNYKMKQVTYSWI